MPLEYSKKLTSRLTLRRSSVMREFIPELELTPRDSGMEADRYAEYVAIGWREPEPQDIGGVVFDRNHRRTEPNLIRARKILRESYLSRHGGGNGGEELANIYFDQAMKTRPDEAWEVLKGDSKRIWYGKKWKGLTLEQRKLILPMMKNYIEC